MKQYKANKLINRFKFLNGIHFDVDDGWFKILWELCEGIEKLLDNLPENEKIQFKAEQIKEKFGGLRFYVFPHYEEIQELIYKYERKTFSICEACGCKGKSRKDLGWVKTYCTFHYYLTKIKRYVNSFSRKWKLSYYRTFKNKIKQ